MGSDPLRRSSIMEEMEKIAPFQHPILPEIASRWSPLAFSERAVEPDKLQRLFEAARWAASSNNEQPWSYIVGRKDQPEDFERLAACLVEGNAWARKAPVLALSVARTVSTGAKPGQPNRYAFHDVGMASENLWIQAIAEGLIVHQMAGYDVEKARTDLGLPKDHEPVAMIAIGYYGDHARLPDKWRTREEKPRLRKTIEEFVFRGRWGN